MEQLQLLNSRLYIQTLFIWHLFFRSSFVSLPSQSHLWLSKERLKAKGKSPYRKAPLWYWMKAWWNVPSAIYSIQPLNTETYSSMSNTVQSSNVVILCFCAKKFNTVSYVSLWTFWITYFTSYVRNCLSTFETLALESVIGCSTIRLPWDASSSGLSDRMWRAASVRWLTFCTVKVHDGENIVQLIACGLNLLHQQADIFCFMGF